MVYPRSGLPSGAKDVKILLLGSKGVGKTALVVRFLTKRFIGDYDQTSDQMYKYKTTIGGKHTTFHIYDTCGDWTASAADGDQDEAARFEHLLKWADAVLLLFSLVEPETFEKIERFRKQILQHSDDAALIVVGTKSDLIDCRRMQTEQLIEYSGPWMLDVYRSSARESFDSVLAVFQRAYKEAASRSGRHPSKRLKFLFQNTLRSYLVRGNAENSEKQNGGGGRDEKESTPEKSSEDQPCGDMSDYRTRTLTL